MNFLREFFSYFLDFIYPHFCNACKSSLKPEEIFFCENCWQSLQFINEPYCHSCGAIQEEDNCSPEDFIFSEARCLAQFDEELLREAIHYLKYNGRRSIGVFLGEMLGQVLLETEGYRDIDFIVPVPLHKTRYRERGYNQSELISKGISEIMGKEVLADAIFRTRHTKSQTTLNLEQRKKNVSGAFRLRHPEKFRDKKILLVDDVLTTGSTLNSCTEPFLLAGAKKVLVATVAKA